MTVETIIAELNKIGAAFNKLAAQIELENTSSKSLQDERLSMLQRRDRITATLDRTRNSDERATLLEELNKQVEEIKKVEHQIFLKERAQ